MVRNASFWFKSVQLAFGQFVQTINRICGDIGAMAGVTILFADNDDYFRNGRAEFLERVGYVVKHASSPEEALKVVEGNTIDLAILDMRLVNDNDEKDISGQEVAKRIPDEIPKIILTGYPNHSDLLEMMAMNPSGISIAIDYISKHEGAEKLLLAVNKVVSISRMLYRKMGNQPKTVSKENDRDIFIVHGHDDAARHALALFIERLGLNAIILSEQVTDGRTIINLLEQYSDVGFAIVLLTPDDVGYPKGKKA